MKLEFSSRLLITNNTIERNRLFGAEFLFSKQIVFAENHVLFNTVSIGITEVGAPRASTDMMISRNHFEDSLGNAIVGSGNARITLVGNTIERSGFSAFVLTNLRDSTAYHNNVIGHGEDYPLATVSGTNNSWDHGHPDGGNFWSDYAGVDACSGPNQDVCTGPDGFGDTPLILAAENTDHYPFMALVRIDNRLPSVAGARAAPGTVIPGEGSTFSATLADPDGDPLMYILQFGDGSSATGSLSGLGGTASARHAYSSVGTYTARLDVTDGRGGAASATVSVSVVAPAFLRVTTGIDLHPDWGVPAKILVDGVPRDEWGLTWTKIVPGPHTISFGDVPGLGTPGPVGVSTETGMVAEARGLYHAYGWLRVITDPPVPATIRVNGVPRNDWGIWVALPTGAYEVSFGLTRGFAAPGPQTAVVEAEQLTTVVGRYVFDGSGGVEPAAGLLRVETRRSDGQGGVPSTILVDGIPRDTWGLNWVKLPQGIYRVAFTDVPGFGTPEPVTIEIRDPTGLPQQMYNVRAVFEVHGGLRVITNPPVPATIYVDGVPRNDWGMWQSMPPGAYEVSFGAVPGFVTPPPQTVEVVAGMTTTVVAPFAAEAATGRGSDSTVGSLDAKPVDQYPPLWESALIAGEVPRIPSAPANRYRQAPILARTTSSS